MTIFLPILGFIFFFVLIVLILGLTILSKVIRTILGFGQKMTGRPYGQSTSSHHNSESSSAFGSDDDIKQNSRKKNKVFDADEGEYVDFEEIKEE